MDTRRLLSTTLLYGIADVIVLAVGGFLLLPLYTHTLSQSEFGLYVVVRANTDILTYVLYLGLPSAVARVYFDYRKTNEHVQYLSSVLTFFLLNLLVFCGVLLLWGTRLWTLLAPAAPADPYLAFSLSIAAVGFLSAIASLWLRLEGRATIFAGLQVGASLVLAAVAVINLTVLGKGLPGLLFALVASSAAPALALAWLFGRKFRLLIRWSHISASLRYAIPIVVGYLAYFILNRISTLILQRHVAINEIAVFGLAQQLAMIVTIAGTAFGKASQPAVFGAEPFQAEELMARSARIMTLLMFCVTTGLILFASDLFTLVAPASYSAGYEILLILLVGNFAFSLTFISDTVLLYHRRPKTSVSVSLVGAIISASLGLWLIPQFKLYGAAWAIAGAFLATTLLSHLIARRATRVLPVGQMWLATGTICALAAFGAWQQHQGFTAMTSLSLKVGIAISVFGAISSIYFRRRPAKPCSP